MGLGDGGRSAELQDAAPPFATAEALNILTEDLRAPRGELFAEFDTTPVASASLGQVRALHAWHVACAGR